VGDAKGGIRLPAWFGRAKVTQITIENLIEQAEEARRRAIESREFSAAVAAIREMGVLSGKRIERSEVGPPASLKRSLTMSWNARWSSVSGR
jgi:hypothetical protein